jgi:pimeloyl-ACP methyl ester carboxylesterase
MCQAIYFHGQPGSPNELRLAGQRDSEALAIFAPDRNADRPELPLNAYFDHLANSIRQKAAGEPVRLVGFSIGSFVALEIAHRLGEKVAAIDLISPAAALELGDFLPARAGKAVFQLARDKPRLFSALTSAQGLMTRHAPSVLYRSLFATTAGADVELSREPQFKAEICSILAASLANGAAGYRREISGYVQPWSASLSKIAAPMTLWHGTADTWSPFAMSQALQRALPNAKIEAFEGLSHYSTLRTALPRTMARQMIGLATTRGPA